jgi:hypothetical protein
MLQAVCAIVTISVSFYAITGLYNLFEKMFAARSESTQILKLFLLKDVRGRISMPYAHLARSSGGISCGSINGVTLSSLLVNIPVSVVASFTGSRMLSFIHLKPKPLLLAAILTVSQTNGRPLSPRSPASNRSMLFAASSK